MRATTRYIADGVRDSFRFSFAGGYMRPEHVKVSVGGTLLPPSSYIVFSQTVLLSSTPAAGTLVTVYRDSDLTALAVAWGAGVGAEARAEDLGTEYRHLLFLTQELADKIGSIETLEIVAPAVLGYDGIYPAATVHSSLSSPAVLELVGVTLQGLIKHIPKQAVDPTWAPDLTAMTRTTSGTSTALVGEPVTVTTQPRYAILQTPAGAGFEIGVVSAADLQAGIDSLYSGALAGNDLSPDNMAAVIRQCSRAKLAYPSSGWFDLSSGDTIAPVTWGTATLNPGLVAMELYDRGGEIGVHATYLSSASATSSEADVLLSTFWDVTEPVRIYVIIDGPGQIQATAGTPVTPGTAMADAISTASGTIEIV